MTAPHTTGAWHKSSYSAQETNCVEIAIDPSAVRVRDTKGREGGHLEVSGQAWRSLAEWL